MINFQVKNKSSDKTLILSILFHEVQTLTNFT